MNFKLKAQINRSDGETIRHALDQLAAKGSVTKEGYEFVVEAEMEGASAKELNRTFLSALRKAEKRTTLCAEWTSDLPGPLGTTFWTPVPSFDNLQGSRSYRHQPLQQLAAA